jgi:hypothetical protein
MVSELKGYGLQILANIVLKINIGGLTKKRIERFTSKTHVRFKKIPTGLNVRGGVEYNCLVCSIISVFWLN